MLNGMMARTRLVLGKLFGCNAFYVQVVNKMEALKCVLVVGWAAIFC
jgi:hypothetical protein